MPKPTADGLINKTLYEGRKLFSTARSPSFLRRSDRFSKVVVPYAKNVESRYFKDQVKLERGSSISSLGGEDRIIDTEGKFLFGPKRSKSGGVSSIQQAFLRHRSSSEPESHKKTLSYMSSVLGEVKRMHNHVIRRGVKAGLFRLVDHEIEHPQNSEKKLKVKVILAGPMLQHYDGSVLKQNLNYHDAQEHGTLGADASFRGEMLTSHLSNIVNAVRDSTNPDDSYNNVNKKFKILYKSILFNTLRV